MLAFPYLSRACVSILIAGTISWGQEGESGAELMRRIERLEKQNETLRASYAQARTDADEARRQMNEIKDRMEALGGAALGNSEDRLLKAVVEIRDLSEKVQALHQASVSLCKAIEEYMKQAVSEDAEARKAVETSIRQLDLALEIRSKPVHESAGTQTHSIVLSIDSESGLLVLNAGKVAGMRVGMPLVITRGAQTIAEAVVTDVRKDICGALVTKLQEPTEKVRVEDSASVKTNN